MHGRCWQVLPSPRNCGSRRLAPLLVRHLARIHSVCAAVSGLHQLHLTREARRRPTRVAQALQTLKFGTPVLGSRLLIHCKSLCPHESSRHDLRQRARRSCAAVYGIMH